MYNLDYGPIAFEKRIILASMHLVTALCVCVCMFTALYACASASWLYPNLCLNNATYAHVQGSDWIQKIILARGR